MIVLLNLDHFQDLNKIKRMLSSKHLPKIKKLNNIQKDPNNHHFMILAENQIKKANLKRVKCMKKV